MVIVSGLDPCLGSLWQKVKSKWEIKSDDHFHPVYDFTKNIVGDEGTVDLLIERDQSPMNMNCRLGAGYDSRFGCFVYENESMETWVPNLLKSMKDKKTKVIRCHQGHGLAPGLEEEHEHEGAKTIMNMILTYGSSPHRAMKMVESIRDQLVAAYPDKEKRRLRRMPKPI